VSILKGKWCTAPLLSNQIKVSELLISIGSGDGDSTITEDLPIPDADSEHEAGETNGDSQSSDGTSSISEEVIPVEDRSASQDQSSVQEEPPDESIILKYQFMS
jgi:hypothetical protein